MPLVGSSASFLGLSCPALRLSRRQASLPGRPGVYTDRGGMQDWGILLYPSRLTPDDVEQIRGDDAGVVWLGK